MKRMVLGLMLGLWGLGLFAQTPETSGKVRDSLQLEKTRTEIAILKKEQRIKYLPNIITLISVLLAIFPVWVGIKNYKLQVKQQRQKNISDLLVMLTQENVYKRASAAKGLSRYPDDVVCELISSLILEEDEYVRECIEETLGKINEASLQEILDVHKKYVNKRTILYGKLKVMKVEPEKIEAMFRRDKEMISHIPVIGPKYLYDYGKTVENRDILFNQAEEVKEGYVRHARIISDAIERTARIIVSILKNSGRIETLSHVDFSWSEMYKATLRYRSVQCADFSYSILRRSCFIRSEIKDSYFNAANLYGVRLVNVSFVNCQVKEALLLDSSGKKVSIVNSNFRKCNLKGSRIEGLELLDAVFFSANLNRFTAPASRMKGIDFVGARLNQCVLDESELENCNFSGSQVIEGSLDRAVITHCNFSDKAKLLGVSFKSVRLYKCRFLGSVLRNIDFSGACIEDCEFNGSDLSGSDLSGAVVRNSDWSGAKLEQVGWENCRVENCKGWGPPAEKG